SGHPGADDVRRYRCRIPASTGRQPHSNVAWAGYGDYATPHQSGSGPRMSPAPARYEYPKHVLPGPSKRYYLPAPLPEPLQPVHGADARPEHQECLPAAPATDLSGQPELPPAGAAGPVQTGPAEVSGEASTH